MYARSCPLSAGALHVCRPPVEARAGGLGVRVLVAEVASLHCGSQPAPGLGTWEELRHEAMKSASPVKCLKIEVL